MSVCSCDQCCSFSSPKEVCIHRLPEPAYDLNVVDACMLQDGSGKFVRFSQVRTGHLCIVVFVRNFIEQGTIEYVEDFASLSPELLRKRKMKIVMVASAGYKNLRAFSKETRFKHEIYTDASLTIHRAVGLYPQQLDFTFGNSNPHLKSGPLKRFLMSTKRAATANEFQGSLVQMGGQTVVTADGRVKMCHRDRHTTDQYPISWLLQSAGLLQSSVVDDFCEEASSQDVRKRNLYF